ncbi:hypothetical protein BH11PSE2_BH11PSE2_06210 [soil metagenome]
MMPQSRFWGGEMSPIRIGLIAIAGLLLAGSAVGQGTGQMPARWISGPNDEEIKAAWPAAARAKGLKGEAFIECVVTSKSVVKDCKVLRESVAGEGFGEAALGLIPKFRPSPARQDSRPVDSVTRFILQFPPNQPMPPITVDGLQFSFAQEIEHPTDEHYAAWPRAAKTNAVEGWADLNCVITLYGELEDCAVGRESKVGLGFGAAAMGLISKYKFSPAEREGMAAAIREPIRVEFRCNDHCAPFTPPKAFTGQLLAVNWNDTPSAADIDLAYPKQAPANTPGDVMLFCRMWVDGTVKTCSVSGEAPAGMGFGKAALSLSGKFKTINLLANGKPIKDAAVQILISFSPKDGTPALARGPTNEHLAVAFAPVFARPDIGEARAVLRCRVAALGAVEDCKVEREEPGDSGVAAAVLSLVSDFKIAQWGANGRPTLGSIVRIPIRFSAIAPVAKRIPAPDEIPMMITRPDWQKQPSGDDVDRLFPRIAMSRQQGGAVRMTCKVKIDGALTDCIISSETPPGYGFGDAALKMAPLFKMKPLMLDGHVVDGMQVEVPIMFRIG